MENQENQSSLLLCLAPNNVVVQARITGNQEIEFRKFIDEHVQLLYPSPKPIPNELLLRIDFKNPDDIPKIEDKFPYVDLARILEEQSVRREIKITAIPLYNAWGCSRCNLDPLDPENAQIQLNDFPDYSPSLHKNDHNFIGIRTDLGLHLFSSDENGDAAIKKCLQYHSNHFFDIQKGNDRLDIVTVRIIGDEPEFTGNKFSTPMDWAASPLNLTSDFFYQNKVIIEIPESKFDMLPTLDNYCRLLTENGITELTPSEQLYDFTSLIRLNDGSCTNPDDLESEFHQVFSFENRFYDLADDLDDCDDAAERAEVGQRIRDRAAEIMEKEFPELHFCRDPKIIEAELQQAQQIEEPITNAYKGPKI